MTPSPAHDHAVAHSHARDHAPKQVAGHMAVLAGGAAGLAEVLIMYPLDLVKTRMMLQLENGKGNVGVYRTLSSMVRGAGLGALYRGLASPVFMEVPKRAVKFAVNDTINPMLLSVSGQTSPSQATAILSGAAAGAAESFIVAPFEKVKIRMQDLNSLHRYASSVDCFRKTLRAEGVATFFKGLVATVYCQGVWSAGYFGTIWRVRSLMEVPRTRAEKLGADLLAGFTGGLVGTMINTPFDVTKSRVQNMEVARGAKLPNPFVVMANIARTEGVGAWFKGFKPKAMRLAPGGGILLAIFEQAKSSF